MVENRLIDLETKFSHQEHTIDELQKIIHEQGSMIAKLEKNVKLLTDNYKKLNATQGSNTPPEKPPHY